MLMVKNVADIDMISLDSQYKNAQPHNWMGGQEVWLINVVLKYLDETCHVGTISESARRKRQPSQCRGRKC